ncbi:MAG TPA: hypothetical protein QGF58_01085 [Myxococcota bacterium]|nr:hypothetical protein [Myxococcota bacterium]
MFVALLIAPAFAQDALASTDDEFDFLVEGDRNAELLAADSAPSADDFDLFDSEEDDDFADFRIVSIPVAQTLPYGSAGQVPLSGNYDASVVHVDRDSVVVELPVLVGRSPADFEGAYWLVGEVFVDGNKVGETRQMVTASSLAMNGPTVAFLKLQAPVASTDGNVEVKVSKDDTALFEKAVDYRL